MKVLVQPLLSTTVKVIEYEPAFAKQCVGFCNVEAPSPPKLQFHVEMVPPATLDASVKLTHKGAHPLNTSAANTTVGFGNTVTVTVAVTAGEQPSVAVTVYVVVPAGLAVGLAMFALLNPAAGLHEYVYGPPFPLDANALIPVLAPGQIDAVPVAITLNNGFTVTVTVTPGAAHPFASVAVTV